MTAARLDVLHVAVSTSYSGTERVIVELACRAAAEGLSTGVVLPVRSELDPMAATLQLAGVRVLRAGDLFSPDRGMVRSFLTFWRIFRRERPKTVHFHIPWAPTAWEALLAARVARVPVVIRTEHNPIPARLKLRQRLKMRLVDTGLSQAVFVSSANAEKHLANGRPWLKRWSVIPNGIPAAPSLRDRDDLRAETGIRPEAVVAAMVGTLESRKGPLDFIRAAAEAIARGSDLQFVVCGDGPLRESAEELARQLGIGGRVSFLGHRRDLRELLPAFDIYVQPSHFEGLSIAMLEALAAGLPMVTTRVDGVAEVLDGQDGALVCEIGDTVSLGAAMHRLGADPGLRQRLSAVARARVLEDFSADAMYRRYQSLYARLATPEGIEESTHAQLATRLPRSPRA